VVGAIFISACVAGFEAIARLVNPESPTHLLPLALAGLIEYLGNLVAVGLGFGSADPLIGLAITGVMLDITWDSRRTVKGNR
jgi:divalent metal cation (Fe/Co/Zn/Cd) transporter